MVNNALLAAGAGWALGLTPDELACGLEAASITGGRLRCFQRDGITIFDDTYNSNPESVRVAIDVVAEQATRNGNTRTVVLGVMAELGRFAEELHHQVGEHAAAQGVRVVSVGKDAAKIAEGARDGGANTVEHFDDYDEAAAWLQETLHAGDVVLFKGSRTAAVEKIMNKVFPDG
jgi:UDP-N-acetylmuramoyl-tripeptide--D-alanyl-D-alanine ligase